MAIAIQMPINRRAPYHRPSEYRRPAHLRLVTAPIIRQQPHRIQPIVYRRRRLMVGGATVSLLAIVVFGLVGAFGGFSRTNENTLSPATTPHVVIAQSGDTLWAIARRITPVGSITELVDQLVLMNGDEITAGQEVQLP